MRTRTLLIVGMALLAAFCFACSKSPMDTKITGDTPEEFKQSLDGIRSEITPEQARMLEAAIMKTVIDLQPRKMLEMAKNPDAMWEVMKENVVGKTPNELIEAVQNKS